jgi:hypothetical protein
MHIPTAILKTMILPPCPEMIRNNVARSAKTYPYDIVVKIYRGVNNFFSPLFPDDLTQLDLRLSLLIPKPMPD